MIGAQRIYCKIEKEVFTLVLSVRAFRVHMGGHVIVYSDHDSFQFMEKNSRSKTKIVSLMYGQPYNLEIRHLPGRDKFIANFLSHSVKSTNFGKKKIL